MNRTSQTDLSTIYASYLLDPEDRLHTTLWEGHIDYLINNVPGFEKHKTDPASDRYITVMRKALGRGWTRITFRKSNGELYVQTNRTDITHILNLLSFLNPRKVVLNEFEFEVGEDQTLLEAYEFGRRRRGLVASLTRLSARDYSTLSYFIDPQGRLIDLGGEEHHNYLVKNFPEFRKAAREDLDNVYWAVTDKALAEGWTRVVYRSWKQELFVQTRITNLDAIWERLEFLEPRIVILNNEEFRVGKGETVGEAYRDWRRREGLIK